ncbi:MAG: hypothetical protein RIE08_16310 [Acidimicrobiales bacterium]
MVVLFGFRSATIRIAPREEWPASHRTRLSDPTGNVSVMSDRPVLSAAEMEALSPDERARLVREGELADLDDLDPDFRARVTANARHLLEGRGLLDTESR